MKTEFVWMNGDIAYLEDVEEQLPESARYEKPDPNQTIHCYETAKGVVVHQLRDHLKDFFDSARARGIQELPYTMEELRYAVHQIIRANRFTSCYVQPWVYTQPTVSDQDAANPVVGIMAWESEQEEPSPSYPRYHEWYDFVEEVPTSWGI